MIQLHPHLHSHFVAPKHLLVGPASVGSVLVDYHDSVTNEQIRWLLEFDTVVKQVGYRVKGNPWLIASLSEVAQWSIGLSTSELLKFDPQSYIDRFAFPISKRYVAYVLRHLLEESVEQLGNCYVQ